jgi:hypothetical protein
MHIHTDLTNHSIISSVHYFLNEGNGYCPFYPSPSAFFQRLAQSFPWMETLTVVSSALQMEKQHQQP